MNEAHAKLAQMGGNYLQDNGLLLNQADWQDGNVHITFKTKARAMNIKKLTAF